MAKQRSSRKPAAGDSVKPAELVSANASVNEISESSEASELDTWEMRLRQAIAADERSIYAIAKAAKIGQPQLSRFMRGAGLNAANFERLARQLGFQLVRPAK